MSDMLLGKRNKRFSKFSVGKE